MLPVKCYKVEHLKCVRNTYPIVKQNNVITKVLQRNKCMLTYKFVVDKKITLGIILAD